MLDFDILSWLIGLLILLGILPFLWRSKRSPWYLLAFSFFWLYLLMLVGAVLFPIPLDSEIWKPEGETMIGYVLSRANLIPFNYLAQSELPFSLVLYEIMDNILLTIPFGFGLNVLVQLNMRRTLWVSLALGVGLEAAQLLVSFLVGPYRTVDVTDVILNAAGFLLGYTAFWLFAFLWRRGLGAFVDEVVRGALS